MRPSDELFKIAHCGDSLRALAARVLPRIRRIMERKLIVSAKAGDAAVDAALSCLGCRFIERLVVGCDLLPAL